MGRQFSSHHYSVSNGEVSPKILSRSDVKDREQAVLVCKNFIPQVQGGAIKRSGTVFLAGGIEKASRQIPFSFNSRDSLICLISLVQTGASYKLVFSFYNSFGVQQGASIEYSIHIDSDFNLADVWYHQSGDTLFILSPDILPQLIKRTGHINNPVWTIETLELDEPIYEDINDDDDKVFQINSIAYPSGVILIGATPNFAEELRENGVLFRVKIIDKWYVLREIGGLIGYHIIHGDINDLADEVDDGSGNITYELKDGVVDATAEWRLAKSFNVPSGFVPTTAIINRGRLWFGGFRSEPQRVIASKPHDFFNFATSNLDGEVLDDSALDFTIDSDEVFLIDWFYNFSVNELPLLAIGTSEGIYYATGEGTAITPTNISVRRSARDGSANVRPRGTDDVLLFVDRTRRKIRSLIYSFQAAESIAQDLNILADHIFAKPCIEMFFARLPEKYFFFLDSDGDVFCMSYERSNNQVGWCKLDFGGVVKSICVIPDSAGELDNLYILIDREDGSGLKLERMERLYEGTRGDSYDDAWFLDSAVKLVAGDDVPTHLRGDVVSAAHAGRLMTRAKDYEAGDTIGDLFEDVGNKEILVGFQFESELEFLPREFRTADGTSIGKKRRPDFLTIRVLDGSPFDFFMTRPTTKAERESFAVVSSFIKSLEGYNGEIYHDEVPAVEEREFQPCIFHNLPSPLNVLSIAISFDISINE